VPRTAALCFLLLLFLLALLTEGGCVMHHNAPKVRVSTGLFVFSMVVVVGECFFAEGYLIVRKTKQSVEFILFNLFLSLICRLLFLVQKRE